MKLWPLILASAVLCACHSERKASDQPPAVALGSATQTFDLSSCAGALTAQEFLKRCQSATALNFTYAADLAQALSTKQARFDGPAQLAAGEVERYLATQLGRCGFVCRPVGPAHLHVFVVERGA